MESNQRIWAGARDRMAAALRALGYPDELADLLARQLYDVARQSSRPLESEDLKAFIARSNKLVELLAQESAGKAEAGTAKE